MTKENHGLLKKTLSTHFLVHTGNIISEASWLYDIHTVSICLRAALKGDDDLEDTRLALDRKYKKLANIKD
jgi:hypothetical protein|tara:strand:- start:236 stop:448 length:213 start_codon:yes stop_codon:yes gene_type:complete